MKSAPSPFDEFQLIGVRTVRGPNYWSPRPVTRLDVSVGAFDEISSAEIAGLTASLRTALPGLIEHRCNIGERGGFLQRLRDGTFAPHIMEHVALELQSSIGHEAGYGRARGGDRPGEYTVVFEHFHAAVGVRAALLAFELVQEAFAGILSTAEHAISELQYLAESPAIVEPGREIRCAVTGGDRHPAVRSVMARRGIERSSVANAAPSTILLDGLPYRSSEIAVILDARLADIPARYQDPDLSLRLVGVVVDAVPPGGFVVVPAADEALVELVRAEGRVPATFRIDGDFAAVESGACVAAAGIRNGRVLIAFPGVLIDAGEPESQNLAAEAAGALAAFLLRREVPPSDRDEQSPIESGRQEIRTR